MLARLRRRLAPLTSRLVVTAVALVVGISLLIAAVATVAVDRYLTGQLDDDVRSTAQRAAREPIFIDSSGSITTSPLGQPEDGGIGGYDEDPRGQAVGTLTAVFLDAIESEDVPAQRVGWILEDDGGGVVDEESVAADDLAELAAVPADGEVHEVRIGRQTYRLVASSQERFTGSGARATYVVVSGLPTDDVGDVVRTLLTWEAVLVVAGGVLAAAGGFVLVRRQLRPLREVARTAHTVAAMPLAAGEIAITERVPDRLTDEDTEVGQVGVALNTLLDHVETSLAARHRSEQQVRQFVADASHELRTPLTTIAGYTELARRRGDPDTAATALAKVEEESARMTTLVEDLLLLARLDAGRPLASAPVDLTRMALEAVADARVVAPDHHWRVVLPEDGGPVEVPGDEQRLHQVLTNLLTNARKYTPEGTTVTVTVRPDGLDVHDDGPGFPAALVDSAFERFTRGDTARQRQGGAGLGLALVRAIVTAHGGHVGLRSTPGDTRVSVTLPQVTAS